VIETKKVEWEVENLYDLKLLSWRHVVIYNKIKGSTSKLCLLLGNPNVVEHLGNSFLTVESGEFMGNQSVSNVSITIFVLQYTTGFQL